MKQALIYNGLVRFYNRSWRKLHSLIAAGKNLRKQSILQKRIVRLFKTLTGLQRVLKLGMATAALSAGLLLFQPNAAQAQPEITFAAAQTNPFGLADIGYRSTSALADLDGDGDLDLLAGEGEGNFFYFQNIGTPSAPAFAAAQTNPFGLTDLGYWSIPSFVDLDGDGDIDLMASEDYGNYFYFQNTGTIAAPAFAGAQGNPFGLSDHGYRAASAFGDLDGDGDLDLISGSGSGNFFYMQNTGIASAPDFPVAQTNPFGLTFIATNTSPAFADLDNDGDIDMITGSGSGNFFYMQNTGTTAAPAFAVAQTNPFGLTAIGSVVYPAFGDLDNDGDMDMIAAEGSGNFFYFQNITPCFGLTVFADTDDDSFGDAANSQFVADCIVPGGYVFDSTDCNDSNAGIRPGACDGTNGIDDNCDGATDNGFATTTFYADGDGDGYGDLSNHVNECSAPVGYVGDSTDCDDAIASSHPGAQEVINGIDDNCDGTVDGDFWTHKDDIAGGAISAAFGFSIGNNGYIGSGEGSDFWEYNAATDAWTQRANYGGGLRGSGVAFSIGNKGYIGTGETEDGNWSNDFWEYDPASNTWAQKANVGGAGRVGAFAFSIGNKGYIGCGNHEICCTDDFWEYDPATNVWTQKSHFGGLARMRATAFTIGNKGYVGTGYSFTNGWLGDFWEYDPATDTWTPRAGLSKREGTVSFSIGDKGYAGWGSYGDYYDMYPRNDFLEYDPSTDAWTQKTEFAGGGSIGFSIGRKGYIAVGLEFWEYTPECYGGLTVYADADGDGYGDASNSLFVADCIAPDGYVFYITDCNDADASIYPGAVEIPNGVDDDCNGIIDDNVCALPTILSVSKITGTTAKLKWNAVAGAEGYTVRYKVANTDGWKYSTTYNSSKPVSGLLPNTVYKWEVKTFCHIDPPYVKSDWSSKQQFTTGSLRSADESPQQVSFQIYPNPADGHATIQFSIGVPSDTLPQSSHVYIKVYDLRGKEIVTLLDEDVEQGDHSLLLNTNHFPKGVYIVKMISPAVLRDGIENQKLIVQ
ncbi:MAG TPA: MopE-related protein [Chitinophagales bacterium]|nr:MopE-related protein [Chitinophagales bacterium]